MTRVRALALVMATAGALMVSSVGARAAYVAATRNGSGTFATTALYAPGPVSGTSSGHDVMLAWTAGVNGDSYAVSGVANGTSPSCGAGTFAPLATPTGLAHTDSGRFTPQGTYYCYRVATRYGAGWTSVAGNPTVAVQLGFVVSSITFVNGGVNGRLDPGDRIVTSFNQPVTPSTGPVTGNTVCVNTSGAIRVAATATSGTCGASETVNLGGLTGGSIARQARFGATWTWSSGNTVLTAVIGTRVSGSGVTTVGGTWTLNPVTTATKLRSVVGAFHVCDTNAGGGSCLPTATGSF